MKLRRLGNRDYRGFDYDQRAIHARPGEVFECSDRRGERLLADYPGGFEVVGTDAERQSEGVGASPTTSIPPVPRKSSKAGLGEAPSGPAPEPTPHPKHGRGRKPR